MTDLSEFGADDVVDERTGDLVLDDQYPADATAEIVLDEGDHDTLIEAAKTGLSKRGCARAAGVSHTALQRYLDAHDDFRARGPF